SRPPRGRAPRPHLRTPLLHPPRSSLRLRPRRPVRPRQPGARPHLPVQPGATVPTSPSAQDPRRLALHRHRAGHLPVVRSPRPAVPAHSRRHARRDRPPSLTPHADRYLTRVKSVGSMAPVTFDAIIKGGRFFDGTGGPSGVRHLGILGGHVTAVSETPLDE